MEQGRWTGYGLSTLSNIVNLSFLADKASEWSKEIGRRLSRKITTLRTIDDLNLIGQDLAKVVHYKPLPDDKVAEIASPVHYVDSYLDNSWFSLPVHFTTEKNDFRRCSLDNAIMVLVSVDGKYGNETKILVETHKQTNKNVSANNVFYTLEDVKKYLETLEQKANSNRRNSIGNADSNNKVPNRISPRGSLSFSPLEMKCICRLIEVTGVLKEISDKGEIKGTAYPTKDYIDTTVATINSLGTRLVDLCPALRGMAKNGQETYSHALAVFGEEPKISPSAVRKDLGEKKGWGIPFFS